MTVLGILKYLLCAVVCILLISIAAGVIEPYLGETVALALSMTFGFISGMKLTGMLIDGKFN